MVLGAVQLAIAAIGNFATFEEQHTYVCVEEAGTRNVKKWGKTTQLSRVARIGFCGTIMSVAAQGFLRWALAPHQISLDPTAVLFVLLGITSLPYLASYKRESYRPDFYFGMLGMTQLFSWCCISLMDNAFMHRTTVYDYILPAAILASFVGVAFHAANREALAAACTGVGKTACSPAATTLSADMLPGGIATPRQPLNSGLDFLRGKS